MSVPAQRTGSASPAEPAPGPRSLQAQNVSVAFEGLRAVDDVTLWLDDREILGLIGPNGAGKTTLTNALSGFQRHDGRLSIDGVDVTGWSPRRLSRFGLRRSFQAVRLFSGMTTYENIEVSALGLGLKAAAARASAQDAIEWFGLERYAHQSAASLPYGLERALGIARCVVGSPRYIILDEPAAGLNEDETDDLLDRLSRLTDHFSCGLLVIEHDMRLIMRLCHRLHVIDHGKTLAIGPPAQVRRDPAVIEAYLGGAGTDAPDT